MRLISDNSIIKNGDKKPQMNADERRFLNPRISAEHTCVRHPEAHLGS